MWFCPSSSKYANQLQALILYGWGPCGERATETWLLILYLSEILYAYEEHLFLGPGYEVNREGEKSFLMFIFSWLTELLTSPKGYDSYTCHYT